MAVQDAVALIGDLVEKHAEAVLARWLRHQVQSEILKDDQLLDDEERRRQSGAFIQHLRRVVDQKDDDIGGPGWAPMREFLAEMAHRRARQGFETADTALFVLSFKAPLFEILRQEIATDTRLVDSIWNTSLLVDQLAVYTAQVAIDARDEIIARQREEIVELSTPVVELWDGVLALPIIGTLDSRRTQEVMEALLEEIVRSQADVAILDITGVPTIDTLTAQHLLKTVAAARLMGAECIISGVRPQIAQTVVHLGIDLGDIVTRSTLASALALAFDRRRLRVVPADRG